MLDPEYWRERRPENVPFLERVQPLLQLHERSRFPWDGQRIPGVGDALWIEKGQRLFRATDKCLIVAQYYDDRYYETNVEIIPYDILNPVPKFNLYNDPVLSAAGALLLGAFVLVGLYPVFFSGVLIASSIAWWIAFHYRRKGIKNAHFILTDGSSVCIEFCGKHDEIFDFINVLSRRIQEIRMRTYDGGRGA